MTGGVVHEAMRRFRTTSPVAVVAQHTPHHIQNGKELGMFWIFMLIVGVAATFTALGMYAVWFKVSMIALAAAMLMIVTLTGAMIWRRIFHK